jgi:hypothetical protein
MNQKRALSAQQTLAGECRSLTRSVGKMVNTDLDLSDLKSERCPAIHHTTM